MKARLSTSIAFSFLMVLVLAACAVPPPPPPLAAAVTSPQTPPQASAGQGALIAPKDATLITQQANAALLEELPFADQQDFKDAQRGFIATLPEGVKYEKAADGGIPIDASHVQWSLGELAPKCGRFRFRR